MVLIANFVAPAAKATPGVNVLFLQFGQKGLEHAFALKGRRGVAMIEAAVVRRDNLVGGLEHVGVDEPTDRVGQNGLVVHGLKRRLGDF